VLIIITEWTLEIAKKEKIGHVKTTDATYWHIYVASLVSV